MTHPLTPREKVPSMPTVDLTDDMLFEVSPGEVVTWAEIKRRTALASGSGDHAELAELREHRITADLLVSSLKADKAEAERKLAEADQVIRDIAETPYTGTDWPRSRAATYLASKEAERG